MFPIFLDIKDRLCLVVGAGPVGRRKATVLLNAGARVRLVCLEPASLLDTPRQPEWRQEPYQSEHLRGAVLAFAAATPEVSQTVAADARSRGIWVNVAADPTAGDFFVPSTVRRGEFVVAVGTGGAAPGLAKAVRRRLEEEFDEAFGQWVTLLGELRPKIMAITDAALRGNLFSQLTEWRWLERIRNEGINNVRQELRAKLQEL